MNGWEPQCGLQYVNQHYILAEISQLLLHKNWIFFYLKSDQTASVEKAYKGNFMIFKILPLFVFKVGFAKKIYLNTTHLCESCYCKMHRWKFFGFIWLSIMMCFMLKYAFRWYGHQCIIIVMTITVVYISVKRRFSIDFRFKNPIPFVYPILRDLISLLWVNQGENPVYPQFQSCYWVTSWLV